MKAKGWILDKWSNNIDLQTDEIIKAKSNIFHSRSTGFPDFVMFKEIGSYGFYELQLVECKLNGKLSKMEKQKLKVYQNKGFRVYVAYRDDTQENNIRLREYVHTEGREAIPRGL